MQIATSIKIDRPAETVWQVLTAFGHYPKWNPFMKSIKPLENDKFEIEIEQQPGKVTTFRPHIIRMDRAKELRWLGRLADIPGLFTGEHYFMLEEIDGCTYLSHGEKFSGILALILMPFVKKQIEQNFVNMNEALKAFVEKNSKVG
ncbi:MAG: SRPBCC family protein [Alphaproteobacteria bacterium]